MAFSESCGESNIDDNVEGNSSGSMLTDVGRHSVQHFLRLGMIDLSTRLTVNYVLSVSYRTGCGRYRNHLDPTAEGGGNGGRQT
jgi:hypothetical protein